MKKIDLTVIFIPSLIFIIPKLMIQFNNDILLFFLLLIFISILHLNFTKSKNAIETLLSSILLASFTLVLDNNLKFDKIESFINWNTVPNIILIIFSIGTYIIYRVLGKVNFDKIKSRKITHTIIWLLCMLSLLYVPTRFINQSKVLAVTLILCTGLFGFIFTMYYLILSKKK